MSSRHTSYSSRSTCDPHDLFDYNSEQRSDTGGSDGVIIETQKFGKDYPYITWKDIRTGIQRAKPKYLLAKDLPHALQDHMNAMDTYWRAMPMNRVIFEASIVENTMNDEPDAPLIKIFNEIDDEPTPPWEFHYSNQMWHGEGVPAPDLLDLISCDCRGGCDPKSVTCACLKRQRSETLDYTPDFAYDQKGQLTAFDIPIFECNDLCGCGNECRNRVCLNKATLLLPGSSHNVQVVQQGRTCAVNIGKTKDKGWGQQAYIYIASAFPAHQRPQVFLQVRRKYLAEPL
jgi:[histone H3]-lysine9 N-trimethyltransferase SUV39H